MILVTGGLGYIGSHVVADLLIAGYTVVVVDNLANSSRSVIKRINDVAGRDFTFLEGDVGDKGFIASIFAIYPISAVLHFAAFKSVSDSESMPLEYYTNNVSGTLNLLTVMKDYSCKKIIFSSSATVYAGCEPPHTEISSISASSVYGDTKLATENALHALWNSDNDWTVVVLRYFNPVGAHFTGLLGEPLSDNAKNVIPSLARFALGHVDKFYVFGNDYPTHDGTCVRDYIHVSDLSAGHLSALSWALDHSKRYEVFNLGTGNGFSVLEVIKEFSYCSGTAIKYTVLPRRTGDLPSSYADVSKSQLTLDWRARFTLSDMCRDAWNFYQKQFSA